MPEMLKISKGARGAAFKQLCDTEKRLQSARRDKYDRDKYDLLKALEAEPKTSVSKKKSKQKQKGVTVPTLAQLGHEDTPPKY
jgi:hypothetical protein